jgi:transposase
LLWIGAWQGVRFDKRSQVRSLTLSLPLEVTLLPEDTACPCCRTAMTVIGEDPAELLDVMSAVAPRVLG